MCYFYYPHNKILGFLFVLKKYSIKYIIGLEISEDKKEPHFQCIIFWDETRPRKKYWIRFYEAVFNALGTLSGKNNKFGKVMEIRDVFKACIYSTKDGEYYTAGFPKTEIQAFYDASFKKGDAKSRRLKKKVAVDTLCETIKSLFLLTDDFNYNNYNIFELYYKFVFNYCRKTNQKMLSKHRLLREAFAHRFVSHTLYAKNMSISYDLGF